MVYEIVSQLDDATTKVYFKSKKIMDANVYTHNQLVTLIQNMKSGDVVYVVSVNRFFTVAQVLYFGRCCMEKGVLLHILAQPYLDLGNGKHWKPSVINQMIKMVEVERYAKANMSNGYKYSNEYWEY